MTASSALPRPTGFSDRYVLDGLPAKELWPKGMASGGSRPFNLATWLLKRAERHHWLARPAVLWDDQCWTYAQLFERVDAIANGLRATAGIVPGNRILLRGNNGPELIAHWLAVVQVGAVAVTTIPLMRSKELEEIIAIGSVNLALCQDGLNDPLEEAVRASEIRPPIVPFGGLTGGAPESPTQARFRFCATMPDDPCILAFTSGTTGKPKATVHSHGNIRDACLSTGAQVIGLSPDDRILCPAPLGFTFGLSAGLLYPLASGAAIIPIAQPSAEAVQDAQASFAGTVLLSSPLLYRRLLATLKPRAWRSLRSAWSGGDMLQPELQRGWKQATGVGLRNLFGTTELFHAVLASDAECHRLRPAPGYRAAVIEGSGRRRRHGTGMLVIQGRTGCRYLSDERQHGYVRDGWNMTGDRAKIDADGAIELLGRSDDIIVSAGYNISGAEVEECLLSHEAVAECAVIAEPDDERGQIVSAYVVLRDSGEGTPVPPLALQDHVRENLAPYKYPRRVTYVTALPRGLTGKVQKFRLSAR